MEKNYNNLHNLELMAERRRGKEGRTHQFNIKLCLVFFQTEKKACDSMYQIKSRINYRL